MAGSERPLAFGLEAPLGAARPLDVVAWAYIGLTGLLLAVGALRGLPHALPQLGVLALIASFSAVVVAASRGRAAWPWLLLRLGWVPISYWFLYNQIEVIWPLFHAAPLDAPLAALEQALFGFQPALAFQAAFPQRWLSELFCFAYYAYYYFNPLMLLTVLLTKGYARAERVVFDVSFTFLACYVFFWLAPTVGPHFWFPPHGGPQLQPGYLFNHLLWFYTEGGEIRGAAFPSSHMAVAVLFTLRARTEAPRLFPFMLATTVLMAPAVVYLRAHYVIDIPPGILLGFAMAWLAPRVHERLRRLALK